MREEIVKLKERFKNNIKFSVICILFIEFILITLPILFNKAIPNITGGAKNLDFLKGYFLKLFPILSVGLNAYSIKLLIENRKLNNEIKYFEKEEIEFNEVEENKELIIEKSINKNLKQKEINESLELLKYMYKTDTDLYIMLLQDNCLEKFLNEKGYDDEIIKEFIDYINYDISGVKQFVRVK